MPNNFKYAKDSINQIPEEFIPAINQILSQTFGYFFTVFPNLPLVPITVVSQPVIGTELTDFIIIINN